MEELKLTSPTLGPLTIFEVVNQFFSFIREDPLASYKIVVGTDSSINNGQTDFVRAVVIHREGKGGRYFWNRIVEKKKFVLRERIYREATYSLELAQILTEQMAVGRLTSPNKPEYDIEIHVDIGTGGPTRAMIAEVVGMIRGSGFTVKTKPEAYAASNVADRYT